MDLQAGSSGAQTVLENGLSRMRSMAECGQCDARRVCEPWGDRSVDPDDPANWSDGSGYASGDDERAAELAWHALRDLKPPYSIAHYLTELAAHNNTHLWQDAILQVCLELYLYFCLRLLPPGVDSCRVCTRPLTFQRPWRGSWLSWPGMTWCARRCYGTMCCREIA